MQEFSKKYRDAFDQKWGQISIVVSAAIYPRAEIIMLVWVRLLSAYLQVNGLILFRRN